MKPTRYTPRARYTPAQLADFWKQDLLADAKHSRAQAENGPFYPDKGITCESLLAYAVECEEGAKQPIPAQFARQAF